MHDWEVESWRAFEENRSPETRKSIQEKYRALVSHWCVDEVTPQPAAYGSDPSHNPESEKLVSAATADDTCWVQTEDTESGTIHEYHLRREGEKWLVEHLFYVDDDGIKYECL